ncbi:MAG: hypothetical protein OHK93_007888 [Ramalina farinacea]|uniref:Uncharacterized protein n=1 Tax=Ramalina farinacea TaxID=258253 RepID=A0AA43TUI9_9LECA|nr:hypothetical protein [Ramalina farinacea]
MDDPKHPMTPNLPKIDPTTDAEASPDDAATACPTAGNDIPPDKVAHKLTHRGGKSKGKGSKNPKGANDLPEIRGSKAKDKPDNGESKATPEKEQEEVINTQKSKPTGEGTGYHSTGQSTKGETIKGKHRWSAGDLDEQEDCERTSKARELVKVAWEALDELARMVDEEEV